MKAILLAGGKGTRLRPLTIHTPKPIVPIFGRPFLHYQIDLVRKVPEIDEVILSLNYQPRRIEEVFGHGEGLGIKISYVVEPTPLGTAGAVKYAGQTVEDTVVVFNGDVMTEVDLAEVLRLHRERKARATIVLTPVENPTAYGLVETDEQGNVRRFLEKPKPEEITCNTINAGIYVLEPDTFDRIPKDTNFSIEHLYAVLLHYKHPVDGLDDLRDDQQLWDLFDGGNSSDARPKNQPQQKKAAKSSSKKKAGRALHVAPSRSNAKARRESSSKGKPAASKSTKRKNVASKKSSGVKSAKRKPAAKTKPGSRKSSKKSR